jgi:hypothetical protein
MGNATVQETKNWMQGRSFDITRVPDNFTNYLLATAMTSRYSVDKNLKSGDAIGLMLESVAPPISALQQAGKDIFSVIKSTTSGEEIDPKVVKSIPGIGRWYYNMFLGGAEEFLEREEKRKD